MNRALAAALLACGLSIALASGCTRKTASEEPLAKTPPEAKPVRGPRGEPIVHIDRAAQERMGLQVADLAPLSLRPELRAYGRVVSDPSQTWELRAPVAGTVRASGTWPGIGDTLADGATLGSLEPRLSAVERADLAARLAAAKGEQASASAAIDVAQTALERARTLNADGKNVSDRALQEAEGRVKEESARLAASSESRRVLEAALDPKTFSTGALPLVLERGGEVVDLRARPGEAVEAGAPLARIERFDPALVRVELPIGESVDPPERALVVPVAHPDRTLEGRRVALAPTAEAQGQALLFRVTPGELRLRPGQAVTAWIERPVPPQDGAIVPRSAVVRHAGKAWVYVQTGDEEFAREEVALDHAVPEGWFVTADWARKARAVVTGAQSVLSTEILSASSGGAEEQ
jgi:hypothetical protein